MSETVIVQPQKTIVLKSSNNERLIVQPQQTIRLVAAARGPKGDGANPTVTMIAGAPITVNQVLYKSNGYVYPASASVQDEALQVVGLATQSVILGASVVILITGERTDAALSYGATKGILFLRENGAMSLTPPASGVMLPVAKITGSTTIFFDTKTPIII